MGRAQLDSSLSGKTGLEWVDLAWWLLQLPGLCLVWGDRCYSRLNSGLCHTDGSLGTVAVATGPAAQPQHQEYAG